MTKTLEFYAIFTIKRLVIRIFLYFKLPQVQKKTQQALILNSGFIKVTIEVLQKGQKVFNGTLRTLIF